MSDAKQSKPARSFPWVAALTFGLIASALLGCSTGKPGEGLTDKALQAIGLKKPEPPPEIPESAKPPRRMKLRMAASDSLNVDAAGRSLSLVVRVYKLRGTTAFLNAPYEIFGNPAKEKEVLGEEVIESRDVLLLPGQQQQFNERWAREATHVGVVGLFRAPDRQRWRYAFELETAKLDDGFVLGAHACTLSIAAGEPVGVSASALKLSPTVCR